MSDDFEALNEAISDLRRVIDTRTDFMQESIRQAVREAMPVTVLNEDEHRWVRMAIQRETSAAEFRKKIIESTTLWAVIALVVLLMTSLGALVREYAIKHGMWAP